MNDDGQISSSIGIVAIPCDNKSAPQSTQIFKLNVDYFTPIFEWLSLADLLHLRRTCKRIKAVVDRYNCSLIIHSCVVWTFTIIMTLLCMNGADLPFSHGSNK